MTPFFHNSILSIKKVIKDWKITAQVASLTPFFWQYTEERSISQKRDNRRQRSPLPKTSNSLSTQKSQLTEQGYNKVTLLIAFSWRSRRRVEKNVNTGITCAPRLAGAARAHLRSTVQVHAEVPLRLRICDAVFRKFWGRRWQVSGCLLFYFFIMTGLFSKKM